MVRISKMTSVFLYKPSNPLWGGGRSHPENIMGYINSRVFNGGDIKMISVFLYKPPNPLRGGGGRGKTHS